MFVRRILALALMAGFALVPVSMRAADTKNSEKSKAALQELAEFIGQWNGNGEGTVEGKKALWKETWSWGWKFAKDADPALKLEIKDGKFFSKAEVKYDLEKKVYLVAAADKDGKEQEFTGKLVKGKFVMERTDAKTKDLYRLTVNTAAEGIRFVGLYEKVAGGKGLGDTIYKVSGNKDGESFAGGGKKNECCVTGGLGTMTVSFMGKTYYVCCSGCRDEFNDNPKKYAEAFDKKKK